MNIFGLGKWEAFFAAELREAAYLIRIETWLINVDQSAFWIVFQASLDTKNLFALSVLL